MHLDRGETLIVHLGMSGRMRVERQNTRFHRGTASLARHDHVVRMEDGTRVVFNDPRRFGAMDLDATDRLDTHWLLAEAGPEPLNAFGEDHLVAAFRGATRR